MHVPAIKLSMAASFCAYPCKLVRHITSTKISSTKFSPSPCWWRITTCAHLSPATHVGILPRNNLHHHARFTCRKIDFPSGLTRSSSNKDGLNPNRNPNSNLSSGSGTVADMDPENEKAVNSDWYYNQLPSSSPSMQQQQSPSKFLTLPTILTIGRVAAVPLLICSFYVDSWFGRTATTSIFIAAAITDWLDGYIARKMRLGSTFGAFLDPVADKLMVAATLVLLCTKPLELSMLGQVPWLLTVPVIAIIGREITMSAVREWAASQNTKILEAVTVNNLGKWKTAMQMIALTILLATRDSSLGGPWILVGTGIVLLYISAGLSLWSLAVYMGKISKVLLK